VLLFIRSILKIIKKYGIPGYFAFAITAGEAT
jgi:hypothetical protein